MSSKDEELWPVSEHFAILRQTILKSIAAFVIAFVLLLTSYPFLLDFLTSPYVKSLLIYSSEGNIQRSPWQTELLTNNEKTPQTYFCKDCNEIPLAYFAGASKIDQHIHLPSGASLLIAKNASTKGLVLLGPAEGFIAVMKIALWGAILVSAPFWGFFLYQFVAPALDQNWRQLIFPFACISFISILAGMAFALGFVIPAANSYLMLFNGSVGENLWSLEKYLDYTLLLMFGNGIAFELGVILFFAIHSGYILVGQLLHYRRHAIVAAFIIAALLTPPDILTQFMLAIPLCFVYECGILYARWRWLRRTA